jgi:hypothetical protein
MPADRAKQEPPLATATAKGLLSTKASFPAERRLGFLGHGFLGFLGGWSKRIARKRCGEGERIGIHDRGVLGDEVEDADEASSPDC